MKKLVVAAIGAWVSTFGAATADGYFDPLTIAAIRGDAALVAEHLRAGAEPNAHAWQGLTPLAAAMRSCRMNLDVLELLIDAGADIEARSGVGATPLMVAWQTGRQDLTQALLDAGADRTARNMYGDTAAEYQGYFAGALPAEDFATLKYTSLGFPPRSQGFATTHCR